MNNIKELKELELHEVENINGGGWLSDVGSWLGNKLNELSNMQVAGDQAVFGHWE